MNNPRILVISSANVDFVQKMRRIPYSGETVVENETGYSYVPGGKGANSVITFRRFGADCVFSCKLGKDANASRLLRIYQNEGINTSYVLRDPDAPTGLASILVEENGKNRIIVYPGANMRMTADDVENAFICYPDALFMHLEIPDEAVIAGTHMAAEKGIPVFIDAGPARSDFPLRELGPVEIFSPNENETRIFTGITPINENSCFSAAVRLSKLVDAKYIVLKLGDRGAYIYGNGGHLLVPAENVEAADTTAAGDVFSAVMTYVYLQTDNIVAAVKYACCAAAISVTREGAYTSIPTKEETLEYVRSKKLAEQGGAETDDEDEAGEYTESGDVNQ